MLKCASIHTYEIDSPEIALRELEGRLYEQLDLLVHSVGVILCHPEFILSGVVEHIGRHFPFDIVGATSASQAVNGQAGELILTMFVMTSDDIRFVTGVTGPVLEDDAPPEAPPTAEGAPATSESQILGVQAAVASAYASAAGGISEQPKLALIFPPMTPLSGNVFINAWEKLIPGTPLFGTIATDDSTVFEGAETVYNEKTYKMGMPFVLCYGALNPRFLYGTFPSEDRRAILGRGEVTRSVGSIVYEIDGGKASDYFSRYGLSESIDGFIFSPIIVDQKNREDYDGMPVMRGLAGISKDGAVNFRGDIDEGSFLTIMHVESRDVLPITGKIVQEIKTMPDVNGVVLFPCVVRRMVIMPEDPLAELRAIGENVDPGIPFMAGYAGGEICPTSVNNGVAANRFHNYSLIILVV